MSFDRGRHEAWEELVSAGITGDLSSEERRRLEAHLAACGACRATWDAFVDNRRIVSGLRHYAPPRDLGARVRGGIEAGAFSRTPWWRRAPTIFAGVGGSLAVVAGALLALVLLDERPQPPVGQATPTPIVSSQPSSAPASSDGPAPSMATSATPAPAVPSPPTTLPDASVAPDPSAAPSSPPPALAASPEPDVYMAVTGPGDDQALTVVAGDSGEPVTEPSAPAGAPIAASLSADGQWLAFITEQGLSGLQEVSVTRLADAPADGGAALASPIEVNETVVLGQGVAGGPFLERLEWSTDGRYLAYTLADPETGPDAWILDVTVGEPRRLTDTGRGYAGSWLPRSETDTTTRLWVSTAAESPASYLVEFEDLAVADLVPGDPADRAIAVETDVFQPLLSPNGALVIYWTGVMDRAGAEWTFVEGGAPVLAEHRTNDSGQLAIESARYLFGDVTVDRDAFTSAAITWGPDGDTYAVWQAAWTGLPQDSEEEYPSAGRVYFGRATDPGGLTRIKALDAGDIPADATVIDVKVSPTGRHLLVTVAYPVGGDLEPRTADLLLIERRYGDEPDVVETLNEQADGWFGPAAFDEPRPEDAEAP